MTLAKISSEMQSEHTGSAMSQPNCAVNVKRATAASLHNHPELRDSPI